jgi:hypothetical protein
MHDTHEVTGSTPVSPTIHPYYSNSMTNSKKSKVEWLLIFFLGALFAGIWLYAHWNLSRHPPHHKGPGSVGYEEPQSPANNSIKGVE